MPATISSANFRSRTLRSGQVYLRRIALWLALLAAVLWLWPTSRLALFLLFQGGGRDSQLALFGLLVCWWPSPARRRTSEGYSLVRLAWRLARE